MLSISPPLPAQDNWQAPKDWEFEVGAPAEQSREYWHKLTAGTELARGKKVDFFPQPNYGPTKDENDPYDLTDGKLSERADDRVWFNKDAVGWYYGVGTTGGVLMVLDLGSPQPIGQIAVRVLGGLEQITLGLPRSIEFLAGDDGKVFYSVQNMARLNPAEKELSDFKTGYYIPEEGRAYMYPFSAQTAVRARYVALRIMPQAGLFIDQISVLKAADSKPLKALASFPEVQVYTDGLVVSPRKKPFTVTTNIITPNWLTVLNNTDLDLSKGTAGFRVELPQGLRCLPQSLPRIKEIPSRRPGVNSYEFTFTGNHGFYSQGAEGPLWIEKEPDIALPADAVVSITGILDGRDSHTVTYPIQLVEVPEVPPIKGLDISLTWMGSEVQRMWPHFLRDHHKLGFNLIPIFPYHWSKDDSGNWTTGARQNIEAVEQGRKLGHRIISNEDPMYIWRTVEADHRAGKIDAAHVKELFNHINGKPGKRMSPLYRGPYFQQAVNQMVAAARETRPDHIYFDIEWWHWAVDESRHDPRMQEAWKASGKTWDDFVTDIGTEMLGTMVEKLRAAVPDKKLLVGLYQSDPTNKIFDGIFQFDKLYPDILDIAMPSFYVQGRSLVIADRIRYDYEQMQSRQIIPWLTAGTYGEFDPPRMEPMILEAILNGSRGITYYWFGDFDPMDFYYHARALAQLAPYEKLLQNGKPVDYKGDNETLHYTCFADDNEALLLVGNYNGSSQTKAVLPPLFNGNAKVTAMNGSSPLKQGNSIVIDVPKHEFQLVHISRLR